MNLQGPHGRGTDGVRTKEGPSTFPIEQFVAFYRLQP